MNKVYQKLAWTNLKNNKRLQMPYVLIGMVIVAMFYTMVSLVYNPTILEVRGGENVAFVLLLGSYVIGIFAAIFIFYTNSFLMKRRKKELGVYNILGMEKRHIAKVLFVENMILSGTSLVAGILCGILFQRLLMLMLFRLIGTAAVVKFHFSMKALIYTVVLFVAVYCVTYIYNLLQIKLANPITLLQGSNVGEKEPKTKIIMTLIGAGCLSYGYYLALTTQNAIAAVNQFFTAVIFVIIGTYFLFIAGSIALLKLLRSNRKFYYKAKHFSAVSGMIYRMKQNAVGLANICILSTMVLVIVSTTVSTYIGMKTDLNIIYPEELDIMANFSGPYSEAEESGKELAQAFETALEEAGRVVRLNETVKYLYAIATPTEQAFTFEEGLQTGVMSANWDEMVVVYFMTREDLKRRNQIEIQEIPENEIVTIGSKKCTADRINIYGKDYAVADNLEFEKDTMDFMYLMTGEIYYCIVEDDAMMDEILTLQREYLEDDMRTFEFEWKIDIDGTEEEKLAALQTAKDVISEYTKTEYFFTGLSPVSRQEAYEEFIQLNGGLLFIGIFLGSMFLISMVLIIYYKQISEGYEDRERFRIMKKVGMSNEEVKQTIHSQVRIVFFLPLVTAIIHVVVAFPMVKYMLAILGLFHTNVFIACVIGSVLIFTVLYYVVFRITSKSYYKIVGEQAI